jgi:hypothetical protein
MNEDLKLLFSTEPLVARTILSLLSRFFSIPRYCFQSDRYLGSLIPIAQDQIGLVLTVT